MAMIFSACEKEPVYGTINLSSEKDITLGIGKTIDLQTTTPEDFGGDDVVWFSTDESVCTVSKGGEIKGIAAGNAQVIATKGDVKLKTYNVTVYSLKRYYKFNGEIQPLEYACYNTGSAYGKMAFGPNRFGSSGPMESNCPMFVVLLDDDLADTDVDLNNTYGVNVYMIKSFSDYRDWESDDDIEEGTMNYVIDSSTSGDTIKINCSFTDWDGNFVEMHYEGSIDMNNYWYMF